MDVAKHSGKLKIKKQFKVGDLGRCLAIQAVVTRERTTRRCNIGDSTEYFKQGLFPSFRMQKKMQYWSNHWISALQPTIRMPKKLYILQGVPKKRTFRTEAASSSAALAPVREAAH